MSQIGDAFILVGIRTRGGGCGERAEGSWGGLLACPPFYISREWQASSLPHDVGTSQADFVG